MKPDARDTAYRIHGLATVSEVEAALREYAAAMLEDAATLQTPRGADVFSSWQVDQLRARAEAERKGGA